MFSVAACGPRTMKVFSVFGARRGKGGKRRMAGTKPTNESPRSKASVWV